VLSLVNEVMPRVWRELGDVSVTIIGRSAPEEIRALASRQVQIAGWVHEIEPLLDGARAMMAPLTYGAGLKGKVTQALAGGLPVVTTPVGAEGLDAQDGEQMLIGKRRRSSRTASSGSSATTSCGRGCQRRGSGWPRSAAPRSW
jgi:glycosyltransferase involved in cell wall biosynthesis